MINKVTLIGHLGKDPETRTLENGTKVSTFSLATSESYRDKNDQWQSLTEWHNIVAWRYLAEKAERELKKGSLAFIEGKITHRKYSDKDGVERSITEIVASQLISLDKKENQLRSTDFSNPSALHSDSVPAGKSTVNESLNIGVNTNPDADDDLPF